MIMENLSCCSMFTMKTIHDCVFGNVMYLMVGVRNIQGWSLLGRSCLIKFFFIFVVKYLECAQLLRWS